MDRPIGLMSVSMDLGAGRRGVDMGPSAIRIAGVKTQLEAMGCTVREFGTIHAPEPEELEAVDEQARYLREITAVGVQARDRVREVLAAGCLPLILGGDHSISIGTVAGVADHHRREGRSVGLLWVDAHTDMHLPPSSPSGNVHGMSLAILTGYGMPEPHPPVAQLAEVTPAVHPEAAVVLGARSVDAGERDRVRGRSGEGAPGSHGKLRTIPMSEVDERGVAPCVDDALALVSGGALPEGALPSGGFHLSFDLDSLDPMVAPGVGTPVPGGFTYREAHLICEKVARTGALVSLEFVELNPVLDVEGRTARLAVELIASALGKTIL
jgi:arginase